MGIPHNPHTNDNETIEQVKLNCSQFLTKQQQKTNWKANQNVIHQLNVNPS
jgi:hypothetical protein